MQVQAIPLFQDAHLLRRGMLEALSDYTFLFQEYLYKGYGDGILAGCGLTATRDVIILDSGILLFESRPYLLREPMSAVYHPTNNLTVLKLKFSDETRDSNYIYREMELIFSEQTRMNQGELELCRFTLQEGAVLRHQYRNFEDMDTTYDTLSRVYAPYASPGGSTLSPDITESFARQMLNAPAITDFDVLFCMQILELGGPVSPDALRVYLRRRGAGETWENNHQLYRGLADILKKAQGGELPQEAQHRKKWRVTVE